MRRALLIAATTGYQIRSFGEAAAKLGATLVFASDRCDQLDDPWWDQAIPVRFHDHASSTAAIVAAFEGKVPDGILAVGDRPAVLAAHAAAAFGVRGNPPAAAAASRNKLATRRAFRAAGLPVPWFQPIPIDRDAYELSGHVPYPAVVKPMALSGSRGVMRVNTPAEFVDAFDRLRRLLQAPDVRIERDEAHETAMIESFIRGTEFAVEALLDGGELRTLAVFDKPDPLDGPFFEETLYITPSRAPEETQQRIRDAIGAAVIALGLHHGPVHAECRVDLSRGAGPVDPPIFVLEVAPRPIGGLCSKALRFVTQDGSGASLEDLLLRHALGEDISRYGREPGASGVMMIPIPARGVYRRIDGVDEARGIAGIESIEITVKPDATLVPLPEGNSYLGFMFARGPRPEAVARALRAAHARLHVVIDREVAVI